MTIYFGFYGYENMRDAFAIHPSVLPLQEDILFAAYEREGYNGRAHVIFQRDGKLFEVVASHCSCYGLGNAWLPGEITWDALQLRTNNTYSFGFEDKKIRDALHELIMVGLFHAKLQEHIS